MKKRMIALLMMGVMVIGGGVKAQACNRRDDFCK